MRLSRTILFGLAVGAVATASVLSSRRAGAAVAPTPGEAVYAQDCSACHQASGLGVPGAFPKLAGDPVALGPVDRLSALILRGRGGMPSFRDDLNDEQIAAALTYVRASWGNEAAPVPAAAVKVSRGMNAPTPASQSIQAH